MLETGLAVAASLSNSISAEPDTRSDNSWSDRRSYSLMMPSFGWVFHFRHKGPGKQARASDLKEKYAQDAKERQSAGGGDKKSRAAKSVPANLPEPIKG